MSNPYWQRTTSLIGQPAQEQLARARIAVFGIGGVGSFAVEALARSGVGHFSLIDHDLIEPSNLNRQIHALHSTIGQAKVTAMKERILQINPQALVETHQVFFSKAEFSHLLDENLDYVIDAIDSIGPKIELIALAKAKGIRLISSLGAGNKLDPAQFKIGDIFETSVCPFSRIIRQKLRKLNITDLKVVYSLEKPLSAQTQEQLGPNRSPGSIAAVPAVAGLILANTVILDLIAGT